MKWSDTGESEPNPPLSPQNPSRSVESELLAPSVWLSSHPTSLSLYLILCYYRVPISYHRIVVLPIMYVCHYLSYLTFHCLFQTIGMPDDQGKDGKIKMYICLWCKLGYENISRPTQHHSSFPHTEVCSSCPLRNHRLNFWNSLETTVDVFSFEKHSDVFFIDMSTIF